MTRTEQCQSRSGGKPCALYAGHPEVVRHHNENDTVRWPTPGQDVTVIHVTQEHIDDGLPYDGPGCHVSRAIRDVLPPGWYVVVLGHCVTVAPRFDARSEIYRLPAEAANAVAFYDTHRVMAPFSFELRLSRVDTADRVLREIGL